MLAKFVEKDYEKADKLVTLRRGFAARLRLIEEQMGKEKRQYADDAEMQEERFLRRLDAGLFTLQTIDTVLAWLIAEDGGASRKITALLAERDETFEVVKTSLQERLSAVDKESQEGKDSVEMLTALMEFL